jgi:GNAT superfamily N-acetyltransferase
VRVADAAAVARSETSPGIRSACEPELSEAWFEVSGHRGRFGAAQRPAYRGLLARLAGRAGFAHARAEGGEIEAVGLVVVSGPWAGIFSMLTLPGSRRRGLGRALLGELARFACARGARQLYLQVERANLPALSLYERAGFAESHAYHYRLRSE